MNKIQRQIVENDVRYAGCEILDEPVPFNELFAEENIKYVSVHLLSVLPDNKHIVGFAGTFKWENGELISLDGDSYDPEMLVHGFEWFSDMDEDYPILKGLTILVDTF